MADLFEQAKRDRVLERLAAEHRRKVWLAQVHDKLVALFRERATVPGDGWVHVTANDARAIFESLPGVPGPAAVSRNFLGAVFKRPGWVSDGTTTTSRVSGSHARRILRWRWVG